MGYERYPRGTQPGDEYNRQDMDYGSGYGSGRDRSYSSAREYQAAGELGRYRDRGGDQGRSRDRDDDQGRYGSREYGNQRYGQREQFGQGGRDYYGGRNYADDQGGGDRYRDQGRDYGAPGGYRGSDGSDGRRFEGGRSYGQSDRNRDDDRQRGRDYGRQPQGYDYEDRGFMARAGDEVRSWFGDDEAERRREMDSRMDERRYGGGRHDEDYHNWRSGQIAALDRDYDEYRREHRSKFENEFSSWRTGRQGQRDSLTKVEEHMDVVGSDGEHVGTVDKVRGDRIILTKSDPDSGGRHHSIPSSWIGSVEDKVTLSKSAAEAKRAWRDEERSQAMFGDEERQGRRDQGGTTQAGQSSTSPQDATGKY